MSLPPLVSSLCRHLQLAVDLQSLPLALQTHALSFPLNLHHHPFLVSTLISAYSRLRLPSLSRLVFDSFALSSPPSLFLWNSLFSSYSHNGLFRLPFSLFPRLRARHSPDNFTLSILSKAAAELADSHLGTSIHSLVLKLGFGCDTVLNNSLMGFYLKCGGLSDARKLFDEMPVRSVSSWNALVSGYADLGDGEGEVWEFFRMMLREGMRPDAFTISSVLSSYGFLWGREIHCYVVRNDLGLDFHLGSCLIDMYSKGKNLKMGRRVFGQILCKNVVIWTAIINGCVENGEFEEGLSLFHAMQLVDGIVPNKVSLVSVLPAIGSLTRLDEGKQVHAFAVRRYLNCETSLNNALIDMYSKCGSLDSARHVFDNESWCKDAISWSSMISCYGVHGKGDEAIALFNRMCSTGIKLDHITSVGVLSACGKAGLVSEGLAIYKSLVENHGVFPTIEICSCIVDMLGRAGRLPEALNFINSMPLEPGSSVWGALFSASLIYNNQNMQDLAYKFLLQLEPENPSNYVSLSNLHASSGRWDFAAEVRKRMKDKGLRKMPGCSWISVNSIVRSFYVADKSHHCSEMIYAVLKHLLLAMKGAGYVPDVDVLT